MDGGSHQGGLHSAPLLQRRRQRLAGEVVQARPEGNVCRGCVLGLQTADPLQGVSEWQLRALQQQLAGEEGPVQLSGRQYAVPHGREYARGVTTCPSWGRGWANLVPEGLLYTLRRQYAGRFPNLLSPGFSCLTFEGHKLLRFFR